MPTRPAAIEPGETVSQFAAWGCAAVQAERLHALSIAVQGQVHEALGFLQSLRAFGKDDEDHLVGVPLSSPGKGGWCRHIPGVLPARPIACGFSIRLAKTPCGIPYGHAKPSSAPFCGSCAVYDLLGGVSPLHTVSRRDPRNQAPGRASSCSEAAGCYGMDRPG